MLNTHSTSESTPVISCHYHVSFKFENLTAKLWIKGLRCGNNQFLSINIFVIENCTFQGQNHSGTVLDITGTNIIVVNSTFISNRVGHCLSIYDLNILSSISTHAGGVISFTKCNISVIKCTFINNSAEVGEAIYSTSYEFNHIIINESSFNCQ